MKTPSAPLLGACCATLLVLSAPASAQEYTGPAPRLDATAVQAAQDTAQAKAVATFPAINTASKAAVRAAYNLYFAPAMPAMGWTGSLSGCTPGTISTAFKEWTLTRVNFFRAMAGLPGNVALDTDATRELQQQSAAVIYAANHALSHDPAANSASFPLCNGLIPNAQLAAQNSNIGVAFGTSTYDDVVVRYMDDGGVGNEPVGHRQWLLYPPQASMTVGSTPTSSSSWGGNALRVFNAFGSRPATPNGIAWPNGGYMPMAVMPASNRWSYSNPGANFGSATVTVTANGTPLAVTVIARNAGYGDNGIVFVPAFPTPSSNPVKNVNYAVTISGILGAPGSVSYMVTPFDPADPITGASNDFNRDGSPDVIFRNSASGATYIWRMNGTQLLSDQALGTVGPPWVLAGVGDFNADGKADILWRNNSTGSIYAWYLNDGVLVSDAFIATIDPIWKIEVVADFNLDGKPDLLLRHQTTGAAYIWYMNGVAVASDQFFFSIDPTWKVEGVGDFNKDGRPDLLFRNTVSGLAFVWNTSFSAGATSLTTSSPTVFSIDPAWEVVQVADWNGDGNVDLLFRNRQTGLVFVWYLNATTLGASAYVVQIDPSWSIAPRP